MGAEIENVPAKIDDFAVEGLEGTSNSLAYKVEEIERHLHGRECWRGKLAVQTATAWADDTLTPFRAISGNDTWGGDANDEAQVLGTGDTPFVAGNVRFDAHRILVTALSTDTPWKLRIVWGTGTMAAAITANQFSCFMLQNNPNGAKAGGFPVNVMMPRLNSGVDKVWMQAWNATDNATADFLIGIHEYEG
jgi:hypothetical protein